MEGAQCRNTGLTCRTLGPQQHRIFFKRKRMVVFDQFIQLARDGTENCRLPGQKNTGGTTVSPGRRGSASRLPAKHKASLHSPDTDFTPCLLFGRIF